jgi:uncharacterized RDD family membrane protein YckC
MKCPKCDYLGFETGDRCKNCGYDFSLAAAPAPGDRDLPLRDAESIHRDPDRWLNQLEARLDTVRPVAASSAASDPLGSMSLDAPEAIPTVVPQPAPAPSPAAAPAAVAQPLAERRLSRSTPALPFLHPGGTDWDEPLIKVPAAPRAPLSVRRTPDKPKLRTVPKPVRKILGDPESDPVLEFAEEPGGLLPARVPVAPVVTVPSAASKTQVEVSGPVRRLVAAAIDHVILLSIDSIVVYFTFQIAGLPFSSWQAMPILPLALFLLMVKGSYFCVFTALGGQTVGKMATGIRVVAENDRDVEPTRALQRTLATLASFATVGIGFAPVLFAGDRRALHDRLAGTRVVGPLHE